MIAYFDTFSGISGDMTVGALVDAGVPLDIVRDAVGRMPVGGYDISAEQIVSKGIRGTRFTVTVTEPQPERHLGDVLRLIDATGLEPEVRETSRRIFVTLAEAEARVHGTTVDHVHFHEVGAVDALVDVLGTAVGLRYLGVDTVYCAPLPAGGGRVQTAHGLLPVPAPGTLEILRAVGAPLIPSPAQTELVTPTGAAIVATLASFEQPRLRIRQVGYGFGRKELPWINALRLWVGEPLQSDLHQETISLLEANLDDMTPEFVGAVMEDLLVAGALDVFFEPIQMKKNRPAVKISVLCEVGAEGDFVERLLAQTTSLGVRIHHLDRVKCDRWQEAVETTWGSVRVKVKSLRGRQTYAPEYDDCREISRRHDVSLSDVYQAARGLAESGSGRRI
jgi:pyridinium-3,5-bisthiocarboxylic acid mononucleotide nickel chelatase